MSSSKVNYSSKPVPSSPGSNQIQVSGTECKKGSAEMKSKLPEKGLVKGK